jgi:hypothetical protein
MPFCSSCTNLLWFILALPQKAFDARGNGTGTPIGGRRPKFRYDVFDNPRFFHSLYYTIIHQIDSPRKEGWVANKRIYLIPRWRIQALRVSRPHRDLTCFPWVQATNRSIVTPCCQVGVVKKVSGAASSLAMALLLENQTWCRTALETPPHGSLSDAQTCGAAGKPN